jgi:glycosyltransferase involved in cell wall biosynthesis
MEIHGKLLSDGMIDLGHTVSVISTRHPSGINYEENNGIDIYYLKDTVFGSRRNGWKNESAAKFYELHKELPFDIIWSQSFDAYGLTFSNNTRTKLPVVSILQGCIKQELVTFFVHSLNTWKQPHKFVRAFAGLFLSYFIVQKRLLNYSDHVITASHQVQNDIKKWFGDQIADKCTTVFNGIDTKRFAPNNECREEIRQRFKISEKDILLLSAGRIVCEKGHQYAIEVLKYIKKNNKNVKLMIVGDGSYRSKLEHKVRKKGLDKIVSFTGFIENDDTPKYYNSSDIFLLPTLREEGLPFVLLELMACEKPVIASHIGGNLSVIDDGKNGLLVPAGNLKELSKKTDLLIEKPDLANKLALSARNTILRDFSVEQMIQKTTNLMRKVAHQKK